MSLKRIADTGIVISLLGGLRSRYCCIEEKLIGIYCNSRTYRLTKGIWQKIVFCLKHSFFGGISEIRLAPTFAISGDSRLLQYVVDFYQRIYKCRVSYYAGASSTFRIIEDIKDKLYLLPVRTMSIIIISALITNVYLSVIFQRQIGLWSCLIRGLIFFAAVAGFFCKASQQAIKESSIFLKKAPWIFKY